MAVWSIVNFSRIPFDWRLDAEYFKPEYLKLDNLLSNANVELWGNLKGKFITGPFGSAFAVENYVEHSPYRYVRGKDVKPFFLLEQDNAYIPKSAFQGLKKYSLFPEDLLVSVVGTLGNVAIVDEDVGQAIYSCKSTVYRSKSIDPYYLCTYLNSNIGQAYLQRKSRGAIQAGLNLDDLYTIPIYIPEFEQQREIRKLVITSWEKLKISKTLYAEAEALLLHELGLKNLDLSTQKSYVANFSETVESDRFDAEYFQPKYYQVLNAICQCGYEHKQLGAIIEPIRNGFDYREFTEDGITPYIRVGDVKHGKIDLDNAAKVKITYADVSKNIELKVGDILFTRKGSFGNAAVVRDGQEHAIISSEIMLLRINENYSRTVLSDYVAIFINSVPGYQQVERRVHGMAFYSISQPDLATVEIAIPSIEVQNRIVKKVQDSLIALQKAKILLEQAKHRVEQIILGG